MRWLALLALCLPASAQELKFAKDRPLDMTHVRLEAAVDLPGKTLKGTAHLDMVALRETRTIHLDAVRLDVASIVVTRGDPLSVQKSTFSNDGNSLVITLPQALARGEKARVTVTYTCTDPDMGLFFFGPTKEQPDVPYQVWSQGETTENRHWLPLFDHPAERVTSELLIRVKKDLQVLSNGTKVGVTDHGDGTHTWHWRQAADHVPYLITLVVGKFAIVEETWRGKVVDYWVPPDRKDDIQRSFGNTVRMLDFFSDKIGVAYPWDKYTQIVVEQFRHGGMENTSATTLTERTLHDARAHIDTSSDGLVAHELAHQWFGDLLTCRDWAHIWLNEGFATYFEALWAEHDLGANEFLYNMRGKSRAARDGGKKWPVVHRAYQGAWQQFDARAYPKGAWILHMIRRRLGDEMWWHVVNRYVERFKHTCVETSDFRKTIEDVTGRSFERFFHDWTARPGHPVVEVTHKWQPAQNLMEVRILQKQPADAWHFPLEVVYEYGAQRRFKVTHRVDEKDVRLFVPLPQRPQLVRIDPSASVLMELSENKGRDFWVRQLTDDPDPLARIRAAEHFGASRRAEDRKALGDALAAEAFWGVQAEIATALGKTGGTAARDVLLKALSLEHPKARRAVVNALAKFKDDEVVTDALGAVARNGDASYNVEADAIRAWAAATPKGALAELQAMLGRDSHRETIRGAALRAIGVQRDVAATDLLLGWTARSKPEECRTAALEALGTLAGAGGWDEATVNRVVAGVQACLVKGESRRVKTQASQTLRVLGEQAAPALSALEALAAHDANERVRKQAQETIDKIRAGTPPRLELQRLQKELQKIRDTNRKLRDRMARLEKTQPEEVGK